MYEPTGLVRRRKLWDGELLSHYSPWGLMIWPTDVTRIPCAKSSTGTNATRNTNVCAPRRRASRANIVPIGQCIAYGGDVIAGTWSGGSLRRRSGFVGPLCIHTNGDVECICGSRLQCLCNTALQSRTPYTWDSDEDHGNGCHNVRSRRQRVQDRPACESTKWATTSNNELTCSCGAVDCWSNTGMYCYEEENMCSDTSVCANKDGTAVNSECVCRLETCGPNKYCSVSRVQPIEGSTSLGCYNFVPATTDAVYFSSMGKRFSIETCQQEAAAYGYKYFGLGKW